MITQLFSPSGRLNRQPFILANLVFGCINIIIVFVVQGLIGAQPMMDPALSQDPVYAQQFMQQSIDYMVSMYTHPLMLLSILICVTVSILTTIKRLHDLNKSGRWYLLNLVPFVNIYIFIITRFQKGTQGDNRFGSNPLQTNTTENIIETVDHV